jgi:hypothetical protein
MKSVRTKEFKSKFKRLPGRVQETAENRYKNYFLVDPEHPLLERHNLHDVSDAEPHSIAVTMCHGYRAVCFYDEKADCYVWYWCGSHAEYNIRFREGR